MHVGVLSFRKGCSQGSICLIFGYKAFPFKGMGVKGRVSGNGT